jgi:ankyrin repeat protein
MGFTLAIALPEQVAQDALYVINEADGDDEYIFTAARMGLAQVIYLFHFHGVGLNVRRRSDGLRAIHLAAGGGHEHAVRVLGALGAHVDAVDDDGWTAAHVASELGHVAVIRALCELGASMSILCKYEGLSPAHIARMNGHVHVMQVMQEFGVHIPKMNEVQEILQSNA